MTSTSTTSADAVARRRGRPILGTVFGLLLGLFVALDLILFGVLPLESGLVWVFIVGGTALGLGLGLWAPFGRAKTDDTPPDVAAPAAAEPGQDDSASTTSEGA